MAESPNVTESPRSPILQLDRVSKRFRDFPAVQDFSLRVEHEEFVTLLGPSGCGKTTVLRMIAGFERADTGSILFEDRVINDDPPERRDVGMVFQSYALFPNMTVGQNVSFPLRMRGRSRRDQDLVAAEYLSLVQLEGFRDRYPHELSGGQRQRVALARALARRPRILLLDEPLSALDARIRQELRVQIRSIQLSLGITAIYVTHDQEEALSVSDRVVVMNSGRIEQIGKPVDIYRAPRTLFVARFIGTSNVLDGVVKDRTSGRLSWRGHQLHASHADGVSPGSPFALAVRPESVRVTSTQTTGPDENRLPVIVGGSTFLGPVTRLSLIVASDFVMHADLAASDALQWDAGTECWAVFSRDAPFVIEHQISETASGALLATY